MAIQAGTQMLVSVNVKVGDNEQKTIAAGIVAVPIRFDADAGTIVADIPALGPTMAQLLRDAADEIETTDHTRWNKLAEEKK